MQSVLDQCPNNGAAQPENYIFSFHTFNNKETEAENGTNNVWQ